MPTPKQVERAQKRINREKKEADITKFRNILIAKYEQHPVLYDRKHDQFKNTAVKDEVLNNIAAALSTPGNVCTVADVQSNWKTLRDGFVREKSLRSKEFVSGSGNNGRKPFPFYDQMTFIEPYVRKRRSLCTTEEGQSSDEESQTQSVEAVFGYGPPAPAAVPVECSSEARDLERNEVSEVHDVSSPAGVSTAGSSNCNMTKNLFGKPVDELKRKAAEEVAPNAKKLSQPLSTIPKLSPAKKSGMHSARSKAKMEDKLQKGIQSAITQLENSLSAPQKTINADVLLGDSIGVALSAVTDPEKKKYWRRYFRQALNDMEDDC